MKTKRGYLSAIIALTTTLIFSQENKKQQDLQSIKSMCGCYEVKFNFTETFQYPKDSANYKPSETKHEKALEWVTIVEESPNKVMLQHLLIADEDMIIKHWRQDWLYENSDIYSFYKDNSWKYNQLNKKEVKGQWTQKVYQVDDSPRYEGTASWVHVDGKHYWVNTTDAPLPRREHTKRNDYNVLKRRNIHQITNTGWIHEQDNDKIIRDNNGKDIILAQEKGLDVYTKVADSKCVAAQKWWEENKNLWKNVRTKWDAVFAQKKDLFLEDKVEKKTLYSHLFKLKPEATKEESDAIIERFIIKK